MTPSLPLIDSLDNTYLNSVSPGYLEWYATYGGGNDVTLINNQTPGPITTNTTQFGNPSSPITVPVGNGTGNTDLAASLFGDYSKMLIYVVCYGFLGAGLLKQYVFSGNKRGRR